MSRAWALGSLGRKIAQNYCVFVGNLSWTVSRGKFLRLWIMEKSSAAEKQPRRPSPIDENMLK